MSNISTIISQIAYCLKTRTDQTATNLATNYYTGAQIDEMDSHKWTVTIVNSLPSSGDTEHIYLVRGSGRGKGTYDEYIWITDTNKFEQIGQVKYDMRNYYTSAEADTKLATKKSASTHIATDSSNYQNDIGLLEGATFTLDGTEFTVNGSTEILGASDVVRESELTANYYNKTNSITKTEFEGYIDSVKNMIDGV